ncbi:MAG: PLP-dependent aminotransferase family protein [Patescibacteria group bacterium]
MEEKKIISFGRGVPATEALISVQTEITNALKVVMNNYGTGLLQYKTSGLTDFNGFIPLKKVIAERFPVSGDPNKRVLITNGGMETISLLLNSAKKRGIVISEERTYDRFITAAEICGHRVVGVRLVRDGIDLEALEETMAQNSPLFFYQIPFHQNPCGLSASPDNIREAARLCRKYHVIHILDVAYLELRYDGNQNFAIPLDEDDFQNTCSAGSFTKTISPGLKCGFGILPEGVMDLVTPTVANTRLNPNYVGQAAIYHLIESGFYDQHLAYLCVLYAPRMAALKLALKRQLPELDIWPLTGGFFTLLRFHGIKVEKLESFDPMGQKKAQLRAEALVNAAEKRGVTIEWAIGCKPSNFRYSSLNTDVEVRITFPALSPREITEGIKGLAEAYYEVSDQ